MLQGNYNKQLAVIYAALGLLIHLATLNRLSLNPLEKRRETGQCVVKFVIYTVAIWPIRSMFGDLHQIC